MPYINKIVIHCSASPQGRGDGAEQIHRWHTQNGWDGIGYHAVILEDGTIEYGRPDFWQGVHAKGANRNSLGVCLIGYKNFTPAQFTTLKKYIKEKQREHNISTERVIGHYEVPGANKTCPNFDVAALRGEL